MKVLLGHNFYQSHAPSGEDAVYESEKRMLLDSGFEVACYERHNDEISTAALDRMRAAAATFWALDSYRAVRQLIGTYRPDVAHFHNTFPLLSPSVYAACKDAGVPVVQTLHNYRLICPGALLMRDGQPCEQCIDGSLTSAIRHACYRRSQVATAVVAGSLGLHRLRRTHRHSVDRYIALTQFARDRFVRGGLPAHRIVVRPNCLPDAPASGAARGDYALFVGRLTREKGVATLIDAWSGLQPLPLKIVGDGLLRKDLEDRARLSGARIEFLGYRPRNDVWSLMQSACMLIIPSECYEGFPVTVLEGLATGTPMIASALGAMDEILEAPDNALKFRPRNAHELRAAVLRLVGDRELANRMHANNRALFEAKYSAQQGMRSLRALYSAIKQEHRSSSRAPHFDSTAHNET